MLGGGVGGGGGGWGWGVGTGRRGGGRVERRTTFRGLIHQNKLSNLAIFSADRGRRKKGCGLERNQEEGRV